MFGAFGAPTAVPSVPAVPRLFRSRVSDPQTPSGEERQPRMTRRVLLLALPGVGVGTLMVAAGAVVGIPGHGGTALAGERQEEKTPRADLVAAVEKGSGPSIGPASAPVVMVEFSDFQCGYCRKFWRETLPKIQERYIRPGKVRFVYRHLAILGEGSVRAAQAASCAHDQGKFWDFHNTLFNTASPLAYTTAGLKRSAVDSRLDERTFAACYESKKHAERVEAETTIGRALGATGTPAFLLNGKLLIGAHPFETFQRVLDALLAAPRRP